MIRLLVTGSRGWVDAERLWDVLDQFVATHGRTGLVVGDAYGADAIARGWAKARGIPTEVFRADWAEHGISAGLVRNTAMVKSEPDICIGFGLPCNRRMCNRRQPASHYTHGVRHCLELAQQAGIETTVYVDLRPEAAEL